MTYIYSFYCNIVRSIIKDGICYTNATKHFIYGQKIHVEDSVKMAKIGLKRVPEFTSKILSKSFKHLVKKGLDAGAKNWGGGSDGGARPLLNFILWLKTCLSK